jgi:hypothetical protein
MTFQKMCKLVAPFFLVLGIALSLGAQTQFSGSITSNTLGASASLANPVYYNETITALGLTTTGALSCTTYPQVTFFFTRASVEAPMGVVATSAGSSWTVIPTVTSLQPGDIVVAQLSTVGVGCTNELPLGASFTTQYTSNVSANLNNLASGASGTNAFVRFRLQNCGTYNPQITGTSVILAYQQDFRANSSGIASGVIYGNDKISCGGVQPTVYEVSFYVNQIRVGVPKDYYVCTSFTGAGRWFGRYTAR